MFLTGEVRKLKSGDFLCFLGSKERYTVNICKVSKPYYLVSQKGYILLVRDYPKKFGGFKRYYYKIPSEFLSLVGERGAVSIYRIRPDFTFRPDTLFKVENVAPTGEAIIEYEQKSLFGELFESAKKYFSSLLGLSTPETKHKPTKPPTQPKPIQAQKIQQTNQVIKKETTPKVVSKDKTPIWLYALPFGLALLLLRK